MSAVGGGVSFPGDRASRKPTWVFGQILVKFNQKYLKILRFIDRAVVVRRESLRFIEILQGSLKNYLGSSCTESTLELGNYEKG